MGETFTSAQIHIFVPEGCELARRYGPIYHTDLDGFIKVANHWMSKNPRHIGVSTIKFHIPSDQRYLRRILLP
jgi:hypothetical protein